MLPLRLRVALVSAALGVVVACTGLPVRVSSPDPESTDDRDRPGSPDAPLAAKLAAENVNAFAADLYTQLRTANGNLIFSPYSVSCALQLVDEGAEGKTASEIRDVAHLRIGGKAYEPYKQLAESVTARPPEAK